MSTSERAVLDNRCAYERLLELQSTSSWATPENRVRWVERVAACAYRYHPGLFADGRLENVLLSLPVRETLTASIVFAAATDALRILHVATRVLPTGGHSRVLDAWIRCDRNSSHALVLTDQAGDVPAWLLTTCAESSAPLFQLNRRKGRLERAAELRSMSRQADLVVLHHHPDDAIPVCAFASSVGAPVIFWNHAHYWFSLGPTVADVTVNSHRYFSMQSELFRYARKTSVFSPVGIAFKYRDQRSRDRADLGLSDGTPVLLSMGNPSYFTPVGGRNLFVSVDRVLDQYPEALLLLVGPGPDCAGVSSMRNRDRVRAVGTVRDPRPYYGAADIVLESFPHPSLGAFTEAVGVGGAFPVPAYSAEEDIFHIDLDHFDGMVLRNRSPEAWVDAVCDALADLAATRARGYALAMKLSRSDVEFSQSLPKLYAVALAAGHNPKPIGKGVGVCEKDAITLAAASHAGLEAFDVIENPFVRYAVKRRARSSGLRGASPSLVHEMWRTVEGVQKYVSRVYRFQVLKRVRGWIRSPLFPSD